MATHHMTVGLVFAFLVSVPAIGGPPGEPIAKPPADTVPVRELRPTDDPSHLALHDGTLYVSGFHSGRISTLDLLTGKTTGHTVLDASETRVVGGNGLRERLVRPHAGGSVVMAAGRLFVVQTFSDTTLLVIDPPTMRVIKRLPQTRDGLLAAAPDGSFVVYASNHKEEFRLIDPETYRGTTVAYPKGGRGIGSLAVSPDGRLVVLGIQRGGTHPDGKTYDGGNSFLAVYDVKAKRYSATVYLAELDSAMKSDDGIPFALRFAPDGRTVYVGMFQSKAGVRVIDTDKWRIRTDIRFAPNDVNKGSDWTNPLGLGIYRNWLWVANRDNTEVVVVDTGTNKPAARLRFAGGAHGFSNVVVDGDRVYVADESAVFELDGWAMARRLANRPGGATGPVLDLTLVTGTDVGPADETRRSR